MSNNAYFNYPSQHEHIKYQKRIFNMWQVQCANCENEEITTEGDLRKWQCRKCKEI